MYPLRSRYYHLYPENPPYPRVLVYDVLKAIGYRTAIVSSQNEDWGQMANFLKTPSLDYFLHAANYEGDTHVPRGDTGFERFVKGSKRSGKIDDRLTINEAISWIKKDTETPFFLYTNVQSSHVPFEVPSDFQRKFAPAAVDFQLRFGSFPKDKIQTVRNLYSDSLNYIDVQLGRLFVSLKELGLWENTLIVITGDNGQAFYEHGFAAHANELYEELVRVAFLIKFPGIKPSIDQRPAQHIDIPSTILDALGLPPHPAFQGVSLLQSPAPEHRSRFLVAQAPLIHSYGIVRGGFKLLYNYRSKNYQLFDLEHDPGEKNNIVNQRTDMREDLASRLSRFRREQLAYYDSATLLSTTYPPKLGEEIRPK